MKESFVGSVEWEGESAARAKGSNGEVKDGLTKNERLLR